ncbi:MAG: MBL fold metallo-hydrolase [Candidatus Hodarchaeota archaeon]
MSTLKIAKHAEGLKLEYGYIRFGLDTGIPNETTLLSHSHADHLSGLGKEQQIIATKGTVDTLVARGNRLRSRIEIIGVGQSFVQLGVKVTALNAGHVLGSSMFLLEFDDDLRVLYTGDFNAVDSLVHSAAKPVEADVLITEATYGTPDWIFPRRRNIYDDVLSVAAESISSGRIPVFQAYSLGKAQEAICLLQGGGINVVSGNHQINAVSDVYNRHGMDLRHTSLNSDEVSTLFKEGCAIVSSSPRHTLSNIKKQMGGSIAKEIEMRIVNYSLSGWTLGNQSGRGFPLSAHSDFPHLVEFAKAVNPRIVYCFTKNAGVLSEELNQKGLTSVPLE